GSRGQPPRPACFGASEAPSSAPQAYLLRILNASNSQRMRYYVTYLQRPLTIIFATAFPPKEAAFAEAFT
ncbi:MAG: hypothetical protein ACJ8DY_21410, partial [Xanthobacteraceae bacterium]